MYMHISHTTSTQNNQESSCKVITRKYMINTTVYAYCSGEKKLLVHENSNLGIKMQNKTILSHINLMKM